jgi:hypothetical protein
MQVHVKFDGVIKSYSFPDDSMISEEGPDGFIMIMPNQPFAGPPSRASYFNIDYIVAITPDVVVRA